MPRIIAGALGGRTIPGPPGAGTRPTSDRVRESLFSRLESWDALRGARVLDLFAGTGALAVEALSRGAASALLVEAHRPTASSLRRTLGDLGLADRAAVRPARAEHVLAQLLAGEDPFALDGGFTLVFLDPPYDVTSAHVDELLELLTPLLGAEALVVLERSRRSDPPRWPEGWAGDGSKRYGDTTLHFGGPLGVEGEQIPSPS